MRSTSRHVQRVHRGALGMQRAVSTLLARIGAKERQQDIALICDTHQGPRPPSDHCSARSTVLSYRDIDRQSTLLAQRLLSVPSTPVGAFTRPSLHFVIALLASWKAQRAFVPLSNSHSAHELGYFIEHSKLSTILCPTTQDVPAHIKDLAQVTLMETDRVPSRNTTEDTALPTTLPLAKPDTPALIVYTSGTTGRPKGVVHTHASLAAQVSALTQAWQYSPKDRILHFLPLYHMHGLLNKLLCVLFAGGTVQFLPSASAATIWQQLVREHDDAHKEAFHPVSIFMAVPTVYAKMLEQVPKLSASDNAKGVAVMKQMRLMVSGSAALPDTVLYRWRDLTGHTLLERYGMTELGMALSNPYEGQRRVGSVGSPLPGVEVRLVDDVTSEMVVAPNQPGELQVSGPSVFKEYLDNPDATAQAFDGPWFRTGDIAARSEDGYFKILGRASSDIIKSSGYKISALEIERELLSFPKVCEASVVAVPDELLGEKIVAVVLPTEAGLVRSEVEAFLTDRLAHYKRPKVYYFVQHIPRNHLGKVNKKTLLRDLNILA